MSEQPPEGAEGGNSETYTQVYDVQTDDGVQALNLLTQSTQAYSSAADNALGKIAKGSSKFTELGQNLTGLRKTNNAATSEAARYQQALSGLRAEVTASTKGTKAFNSEWQGVQKTTKQLARDFPIGIGGAIEQVDALHKSGIKTNSVVKALAKTYTELGAATSESGVGLGQDMTALSKVYGATQKQIDGLADSVTTVTAKLGGSASGTLSFAKQIAPIAATVGIGEAKVIGLSNAFSKMGEDGSGAATAVNRVLLDLNKSIRTGSPEIATYARLLGKTTTELQALFKTSPDEVLTDFFEKIAKSGPDAITVLDQLGLDGVRTSRSIQALARSGGLRESIDTAQRAYGSGSTSEASKAAYGGVNDQLAKLQETTRQTVEATGRPYLKFLGLSAGIANKVAGTTNALLNTGLAQGGQTAGGIAKFAGGAGMQVLGGIATYAFAKNLFQTGRQGFREFQQGRAYTAGVPGATEPLGRFTNQPTMAGRLGVRAGEVIGAPAAAVGRPTVRGMLGAPIRGALNLGSIYGDYLRADAQQAIGPEVSQRPPTRYSDAAKTRNAELRAARAMERGTERTEATNTALKKFRDTTLNADSSLRSVAKSAGGAAVAQTRLAVGDATRGIGRAGGALIAGGAATLAPMAAIGAVGFLANQANEAKKQQEKINQGSITPYGAFNDFAAQMGLAGRSSSGFADAADRSIKVLLDGNKSLKDSLEVTSQEFAGSQGARTPMGFALTSNEKGVDNLFQRYLGGDNTRYDPTAIATRIGQQMGTKLDKDQMALIGQNLGQQGLGQSQIQEIFNQVGKSYDKNGVGGLSVQQQIQAAVAAQANKVYEGSGSGVDESAGTIVSGLNAQATQKANETAAVFGPEAGKAVALQSANEIIKGYNEQYKTAGGRGPWYESLRLGENSEENRVGKLRTAAIEGLATQLNIDPQDLKGVSGQPKWFEKALGVGGDESVTLPDMIKSLQKKADDDGKRRFRPDKAAHGGLSDTTLDFLDTVKDFQSRGFDFDDPDTFTKFISGTEGKASTVSGMGGLASSARRKGVALAGGGGAEGVTKGLYELTDAMLENKVTVGDLDKSITDNFSKVGKAALALDRGEGDTAVLTRNLAQAMVREQRRAGSDSGSSMAVLTQASLSVSDPKQQAAIAAAMRIQQRAAISEDAGSGQLAKLFAGIGRDTKMAALPESAATSEMIEGAKDRVVQQKAAFQDQAKQMTISFRETAISMKQQRQDLNISLTQMQEDYNLSTQANAESHNRQMMQVERDYGLQMKYMEADYFRSRTYALEDFNRQRQYAIEDSAKNLINPYERIGAGNVLTAGGLTNNLKDQVAILRQQFGNIKKLKELGLSQAVIDTLDLYNPANAFQVQRLVMDLQNNRKGAARLNKVVEQKMQIGGQITTSTVDFRRSEHELEISLDRMADQYKTAQDRAAVAHKNALADANAAYQQSLDLAAEQQRRAEKRMTDGLERSQKRQKQAMTRSIQDLTDQGTSATKEFQNLFDSYKGILGSDVAGALSEVITQYNTVTGQIPKMAQATISISYDNFKGSQYSNLTGTPTPTAPAGSPASPDALDHVPSSHRRRGHHDKMGAGYPGASGKVDASSGGYVNPVDLQESMAGSMGTPVHVDQSQHYDHSTTVSGPITVQAQDPHEMAHKLAAEAARKRLVNPVSG